MSTLITPGMTGSEFISVLNNHLQTVGSINVLDYEADPTGVLDSTNAIQLAIDAAQENNGKLYVPIGTYRISDTLIISDAVSIVGENVGSVTSAYIPTISPYLTGTVFVMETGNKDAIKITVSKKSVNLCNFGIKFHDSISFNNTGHGILCLPVMGGNSYPIIGIQDSVWDNIMVFGTDSNHYSFSLINTYLNKFSHLRSYGGGGFEVFANNISLGTGNNLFMDTYSILASDGTSHGYYLRGTDNNAGQQFLNTFIRMQCNILTSYDTPPVYTKNLQPPNENQKTMYINAYNRYLSIFSPDYEGSEPYISAELTHLYITPGVGIPAVVNRYPII